MKKAYHHIIASTVVFLLSTLTVLAQPGGGDTIPCDPDDPYCPLDSWVIVMVIVALVFVTLRLRRQQKQLVN